jgi:amino acid adenylation domain-containing protein
VEWNDTAVEYPRVSCIHELFEAQAERTPESVAVVCGQERLTYGELNKRANQLAHHLQSLGVGPEVLVGICVERNLQLVMGLLAILKAGGAYVPLDSEYPEERLRFTLKDAAVHVVLTQEKLLPLIPASEARLVCLDAESFSAGDAANPQSAVGPLNLAYVIYTSGSTGEPKGVAIEHASTSSFLQWAMSAFTREELSGVLLSTSICFDLSVFELFAPLCVGGKVIVANNALDLSSLHSGDVTLINTVPSAMTELVRMRSIPASVTTINLAGEPLANSLVQAIYEQESVQAVLNLYGPSEDTTYSTYVRLNKGATAEPTIGRPVANTEAYLLDERLEPVPIGVIGELYLGSTSLARGYLNRSWLTAEKFIPHPYSRTPGARLYRTGDLARYQEDGTLQFLGRVDNQVKLRGFRIELGEIEAALREVPEVQEAVLKIWEPEEEHKELVAYVVAVEQEGLVNKLRNHLKRKLPGYMLPAEYVLLDQLPLTPNGKVDRRALPRPDKLGFEVKDTYVAPGNPIEETVAAIWSQVLRRERIGVNDNFFDAGGHSLLITRVNARLFEEFGVEIPLRELFEYPTIAELAWLVEERLLKEVEAMSEEEVQTLL